MPELYLSPSLQEFNPVFGGGTEEEYANKIADALEPLLAGAGISYDRNRPEMTLREAIDDSNSKPRDLHLAIHSNAAPPFLAGKLRGTDVYYYAGSPYGREMAEFIAEEFRKIYPDPEKVRTVPTLTLGELRKTKAPAVLVETAYHDNPEDAVWLKENTKTIAEALGNAVKKYFGLPTESL